MIVVVCVRGVHCSRRSRWHRPWQEALSAHRADPVAVVPFLSAAVVDLKVVVALVIALWIVELRMKTLVASIGDQHGATVATVSDPCTATAHAPLLNCRRRPCEPCAEGRAGARAHVGAQGHVGAGVQPPPGPGADTTTVPMLGLEWVQGVRHLRRAEVLKAAACATIFCCRNATAKLGTREPVRVCALAGPTGLIVDSNVSTALYA
jgi:hypothetical protein